jgi:hypothetical protein
MLSNTLAHPRFLSHLTSYDAASIIHLWRQKMEGDNEADIEAKIESVFVIVFDY